uniref:Uncharacterized protein n=1 Tax=Pyrodinium bahamense TaxID=73915 RepID=A0A7S0FVW4_9DINO|mmetsp:Transcript_53474/g.148200  ORF Transcript_53474/g.148200 Transcript_53474/m.148200 type:complete len:582 (+) Transcript_53474:77-1822(+)
MSTAMGALLPDVGAAAEDSTPSDSQAGPGTPPPAVETPQGCPSGATSCPCKPLPCNLVTTRRYYESRSFSFDTRSLVPERVDSCIARRYEIDAQEIGVGGYGRVYTAKDRMFKDRRVAIKKLVRHQDDKLEAFKLEVDIMKELDHPNICRLFETYLEDELLFFVIEYLEGGDLCDLIMEKRTVEEGLAAYIIKQASSAVRYAHRQGIAHRDMKPENVCFCSRDPTDHRVKVIDWGLGKHFSQTRMKSSVGSGAFTAPEVLDPPGEDAGYTSACDLWSLGVMAYVLLSGKPPFYGGPIQMLRNMREERYPMSGTFWDGVPADAKSFIARLLKCTPEERLSAESLLLHPWLARQFVEVDGAVFGQIIANVEHFSHAPDFLSVCVASVARQLDHRSLDNIYKVFIMLDANGDGVLDLSELKVGFVKVFGEGSDEVAEVDSMFAHLDLDHTGGITYTEFCAAGIGESSYTQEHVLWAAFKTFDVNDNGRITRDNMQEVLTRADVNQVWSEGVCNDVAHQVTDCFGSQGGLNFEEWLNLMRESASQHAERTPRRRTTNVIEVGVDDVFGSALRSEVAKPGTAATPS